MFNFKDLIDRAKSGVKKGLTNLGYVDDYIKQKINYASTPLPPNAGKNNYVYPYEHSIPELQARHGIRQPQPSFSSQIQVKPQPQPSPSPSPSPQPMPDPNLIMGRYAPSKERTADTDAFLADVVLPITREYSVPDALAAGQFAAEGRTAGLGASRNNFFNLGAFDKDLGNTFSYESPQEGIRAYARLLAEDPRYAPHATMSATPDIALDKIASTYASRPDYADWIKTLAEWQLYR